MKDPFTMSEYIQEKELGVSPFDTCSTRMVAAHLRKHGYRHYRGRRDGKVQSLWTKSPNNKDALAEKLRKLK